MKTLSLSNHKHLQSCRDGWRVLAGGVFKEAAITMASKESFELQGRWRRGQKHQTYSPMRTKDR